MYEDVHEQQAGVDANGSDSSFYPQFHDGHEGDENHHECGDGHARSADAHVCGYVVRSSVK